MQDQIDASIMVVVLIPLILSLRVCIALWRCYRWNVRECGIRRAEYFLLKAEEQDRANREFEQLDYNRHEEYLRQRQSAQQRSVADYRVDFLLQPAAGFDHPRRTQLEQDERYADTVSYPTRQNEEVNRRRSGVEERRGAEAAEESRTKPAKEYNRRKQAEVEELRWKLARAEKEKRRLRETAEAETRKRLAEAVRKRIEAEEVRNRRQAEAECSKHSGWGDDDMASGLKFNGLALSGEAGYSCLPRPYSENDPAIERDKTPISARNPPESHEKSSTSLPSMPSIPVGLPSASPLQIDLECGTISCPAIKSSPVPTGFSQPTSSSVPASKAIGEKGGQCVVCWDAPAQGACIPCGHLAGCMDCLSEIKDKGWGCPVCRKAILQVLKFYPV